MQSDGDAAVGITRASQHTIEARIALSSEYGSDGDLCMAALDAILSSPRLAPGFIDSMTGPAEIVINFSFISKRDADLALRELERMLPSATLSRFRPDETVGRGLRRRPPSVGDFYAIPLPDGRFGHGRYVASVPGGCDLVLALAQITVKPAKIAELREASSLFGPVKAVVKVGVTKMGWIHVGHAAMSAPHPIPTFRGSDKAFLNFKPGVYDDWWLWRGPENVEFVGVLSPEQRRLEFEVMDMPRLAERIATGYNPYAEFL